MAGLQSLKPDWSALQDVEPGRKVKVRLHDTKSGSASKGRFASSTDSTITIVNDGGTLTYERSSVRTVYKRRPLGKRFYAWFAGIASVTAIVLKPDGVTTAKPGWGLLGVPIAGAAFWVLGAVSSAWKPVYHITEKHRQGK